MGPVKAAAFLGVQLAVVGVYLGCTFAPNHKGMPVLPPEARPDFLRRQVLTSRNISGNRLTSFLMGGLNYQIEHHLFPSMPRPNLRRAQRIVRPFCTANSVTYTETTLRRFYGIVIRHLNQVGLRAADPPVTPPRRRPKRWPGTPRPPETVHRGEPPDGLGGWLVNDADPIMKARRPVRPEIRV